EARVEDMSVEREVEVLSEQGVVRRTVHAQRVQFQRDACTRVTLRSPFLSTFMPRRTLLLHLHVRCLTALLRYAAAMRGQRGPQLPGAREGRQEGRRCLCTLMPLPIRRASSIVKLWMASRKQ